MLDQLTKAWADSVSNRLGPPLFTYTDEVRFNCYRLNCGQSGTPDTEYHMYINPTKGKYFCQRCQFGGTLEYLTKLLGLPLPEENLSAWSDIMYSYLFGPDDSEESVEPVSVPEAVSLIPGTRAISYLKSRGISDELSRLYNLMMGVGSLKNRIVFPDFSDDGTLVYWQARDYVGRNPKYRNATSPNNSLLYNLGRWKVWGLKSVAICEGVISAISTGCDAVATYGKYVTGGQVDALVDLKAEEYIVAFDGDALEFGISLASRLRKRYCKTRILKLPRDKDPNDLGHADMRARLVDAIEFNSEFDAIRMVLL